MGKDTVMVHERLAIVGVGELVLFFPLLYCHRCRIEGTLQPCVMWGRCGGS